MMIQMTEPESNQVTVGKKRKRPWRQKVRREAKKAKIQELKSSLETNAEISKTKELEEKLASSRFRYLNEQLYTMSSKDAVGLFSEDKEAFDVYHKGYRQQVSKWPVNPVSRIIEQLSKLPPETVIADLGCGDAKIAKTLGKKLTVKSFDLVANNPLVTACDMSKLPLEKESVDVVVFCLSLMGINLSDFLKEANRILKTDRFKNLKKFLRALEKLGFKVIKEKLINDYFEMITLKKVGKIQEKKPLGLILEPCFYKKPPVAELGWRRFQFFDKSNVTDSKDSSKPFLNFKELSIRCWASSVDQKFAILGEQNGIVFKLSSSMEIDFWKAYSQELTAVSIGNSDGKCLLATLGIETPGQPSVLKIWDLNSWEEQSPLCRVSLKTSQIRKSGGSEAISISISPSTDFIAVGFADASVFVSLGDFSSEKSLKWKSIRDGLSSMTDGVLLGVSVANAKNGKNVIFVVCENGVSSFILDGNQILKKVTHGTIGTQKNCWYFNQFTNQLVVSHQEMVYFYDANRCMEDEFDSGRCYALGRGTDKVQLLGMMWYVGVMTKQENKFKNKKTFNVLTLYDVDCRYIACMNPVGDSQLFTVGRAIFALCSDGTLSKFVEKPTALKLEIVLQKQLYDVAISIAKRDKSGDLSSIHAKYADYLYNRGDFHNAIQQYIETIGSLEASFVIRRFLDGTRAAQLCIYIEALHARNLYNESNTMLLLGAYLKMGNKDKIKHFITNSSKFKNFDVDRAIKLLRASGNFDLASYLATEYNRILLIFAILVEDLCDFGEAAKRLHHVSGKQIFEVLDAYGLTLLEHKEKEVVETIERAVAEEDADLRVLVKLLNGHPEYLRKLYNKANKHVKESLVMRNAVLEHTLERMRSAQRKDPDFQAHVFDLVGEDNYESALRLGQLHSYPPLVIHVLRNQRRDDELLRYLLRDGEVIDIIQECNKEIIEKMWIELITFLSKKKDMPEKYVVELLKKVTATSFVHPLIVTNILSRNPELPISCVKLYLEHWLTDQGTDIKKGLKQIEENVEKVKDLEDQIQIYDEEIQIFQALRCAACDSALQIPAVHFMCKHSYHSHCYESYSDQQDGCPACSNSEVDIVTKARDFSPVTIEELQDEVSCLF
ncbi:hypothetical protein FO519_007286 [Halicephalobus sp. NKZ332]|nr:hypothetical protein FO519_007286 [Halicephalobus sp. NKZ332]